MKPTDPFVLVTYDTDAESEIDSGFKLSATMTIAGEILSFSAQPQSFINGAINTFTFSVQASIPLLRTDSLSFKLPLEMQAPEKLTCIEILNLIEPKCIISDEGVITVRFTDFENADGAFSWQITDLRNPSSTQPSSPFVDVRFIDQDGFTISDSLEVVRVTNKFPAQITDFDLIQSSLKPDTVSSYEIVFMPVNSLPADGSIQITYPTQITLTKGARTKCIVTLIQPDA